MSRNKELRKQNEKYSISLMDVVEIFGYDSKYNELLIRLMKSLFHTPNNHRTEVENYCKEMGLKPNNLYEMNQFQLEMIVRTLDKFGMDRITIFNKFVQNFDKNLIPQKDLSKYSSIENLEKIVSLVDLKNLSKEMENEVIKVYEDDTFLLVKPLSWEASKKYGANTRWCTASRSDYDQFKRYSERGLLMYILNKETGDKSAVFKTIHPEYEPELSFWDQKDRRVDSIELDIPREIMDIIKNEIATCTKTNYDLTNIEIRINNQIQYDLSLPRKESYVGEGAMRIQENITVNDYPTNTTITYSEEVEVDNMWGAPLDYNPNLRIVE